MLKDSMNSSATKNIIIEKDYVSRLERFKEFTLEMSDVSISDHVVEIMFESLFDWSVFHTLDEVKSWFAELRNNSTFDVTEIGLNALTSWEIDPLTGNLHHQSKDFFEIIGLRIQTTERESLRSWDQPILKQIGYDGGILGLIRKRFNGIPHYLCEAKFEPGNYGGVQVSPSLQATFANINQAHGGRAPHFTDLFVRHNENEAVTVLFDKWLSEDGGRLYLKRNRGMLIEVTQELDLPLPNENFIWLSMFQIKRMLQEDAWINPHIRGIISHA